MIKSVELFIIILLLYLRTYKYKYLIDDHVERNGMYTVIPPPPVPFIDGKRYDDNQRSYLTTFTNLTVYMLVCLMINYLWGWKVALIYCVLPTNVSGVAWKTGNYYMTTVFLILGSYCFLAYLQPWGVIVSYFLFYGALHSTVSAVPFAVLSLFYPYGWLMMIPLGIFLTGERFTSGLKKRKKSHEEKGMMSGRIHPRNLILAVNVLAYYILVCLQCTKLAFFHAFGHTGKLDHVNRYFWLSLGLVVSFLLAGFSYSPFGTIWFLLFMGVFCNLIPNLGQFVTERYTYISTIGICIILCSFFETYPDLFYVIVGVWFMRSLHYIKAWRSNEALFAHGISAFPTCPDNYGNLAGWYINHGEFIKAIAPLECAVKLTEGNRSKLYGNLGICFAVLGENTGVKKHYRNALHYYTLSLQQCDEDAVENIKEKILKLKEKV